VRGSAVARLTLVLAALGLALSLFAPSASAARSEFFGIVQGPTLDEQDLAGMTTARIRTNRFVLKWGWVQPNSNTFDWESADRFFGELASHGIRALPSLWGNPGWVGGSASTAPIGWPAGEQAWRGFLRALVVRYGPGGSYWSHGYRQRYGPSATPLPVLSWQIWNEPNLAKYFAPSPSPGKYARLLQISYAAIKSADSQARVALAGMPSNGDVQASSFLNSLYSAGAKPDFDIASLHPYAKTITRQEEDIRRFHNVMVNRNDRTTPLWLTELAWGSAPPDQFGINKGLEGQRQYLRGTFNLVLDNRKAWNVQRLFWYRWRDPADPQATCSFCGSAGFLKPNRERKPSWEAFRSFASETVPPTASITSGPAAGSTTTDSTPTFGFASSEHGSTFECKIDASAYKTCSSPHTLAPLADGAHTFSVRAIDAPGNVSPVRSRSFTVDTRAPAAPQITDTDPNSPANDNAPEVKGNAAAGSTVWLYKNATCAGFPVAAGPATRFAAPGITVSLADNTTTSFRARARDAAGNLSPCSSAFTYVEDSTP
jgi:hypothetical protein